MSRVQEFPESFRVGFFLQAIRPDDSGQPGELELRCSVGFRHRAGVPLGEPVLH